MDATKQNRKMRVEQKNYCKVIVYLLPCTRVAADAGNMEGRCGEWINGRRAQHKGKKVKLVRVEFDERNG